MIYLCLILAFFIQLPSAQQDHDRSKCVKNAGREDESTGSCCGLSGEITCRSGYELAAPIPDVCGGDCPENWCNHHNPNSPLRMARSYKCVPSQNVCADGYEQIVGDVPMFGEINGKGGRQVVSSCATCANLCDDEPLCNSYECDTADEFGITCNLNQEAESTTTYCGPICQRQLFCVKQTPTPTENHDGSKCVKHAGREYESTGSCCGTPGEITCKSGYELVAPIPDVCGGDCPENWCNHHNPNSPLRMTRSYKCVPSQNDHDHDKSKCVKHAGREDERTGSCCGLSGEITCKSGYELVAPIPNVCGGDCPEDWCNQHPNSRLRMARSYKCVPRAPQNVMYKALKGCSRNRFHSFQEEVGFYDPSRSVAKIQCCSLDGSTCTRKDSWPHGACLGDREKVAWAQAKQICEAEGMRLCNSQQEVDNCCHRGCGYDGALTWTGIYPGVGSHYAACGRPGRCNAASVVSEDIAFQKVRCVSDSRRPGWFSRPNLCGNISWESDIWGGCHSLTFQAATEFCASQDARLPTREEAESGCVAASGCGFDAQYIWTSTSA